MISACIGCGDVSTLLKVSVADDGDLKEAYFPSNGWFQFMSNSEIFSNNFQYLWAAWRDRLLLRRIFWQIIVSRQLLLRNFPAARYGYQTVYLNRKGNNEYMNSIDHEHSLGEVRSMGLDHWLCKASSPLFNQKRTAFAPSITSAKMTCLSIWIT